MDVCEGQEEQIVDDEVRLQIQFDRLNNRRTMSADAWDIQKRSINVSEGQSVIKSEIVEDEVAFEVEE